MKQAKHQGGAASRKPKKFGVMQLQINRAKIEMGRFEKNTQIQEKEQKREDMVLAATQLAIYEAQDIANNKVSKEKKDKCKNQRVLLLAWSNIELCIMKKAAKTNHII
eukprot:403345343